MASKNKVDSATVKNAKDRTKELESEKKKMEQYVNNNKASKELRHLKAL